jgi:glycosyltransferase involved in cell wall biosynthesis
MIPVLGIPLYNRKDLLQRLLNSIDYPVNHLVVVNNGSESLHDLKIPDYVHWWDEIVNGQNLGCAGGWNRILAYAFMERQMEYALFFGNDVQFIPGDLEKFNKAYEPESHFMSGNWAFSSFGITRRGFGVLGWFDEGCWPAYGEDVDFWRRCSLTPNFKAISVDTHSIHGEAPYWGSSTIYSDPELRKKNHLTHNANLSYLERKWGWNRNKPMDTAKFTHPFNDSSKPLWWWELSEERKRQPHYRTNG